MRADVRRWLHRRTYDAGDWCVQGLLSRKLATPEPIRISVVLPALDEQATVGAIVSMLRTELMDRAPLIDELVVMDSGSTDATARIAEEAGARVVAAHDVVPGMGARPGKGEVLWKSLFVTSGDVVAFVDSDLVDVGPHFVTGLLGPLLHDPGVQFVKAFYDRPLSSPGGVLPSGGGRVTELVARPLINLYWPELAGLVQPLAGEYAARRTLLERLPFVSGYGVEIGMLIDLLDLVGVDGLAQVDLGRREHRNQSDDALGRMASAILQTAMRRLGARAGLPMPLGCDQLIQFRRTPGGVSATCATVTVTERPPVGTLAAYAELQALLRGLSPA